MKLSALLTRRLPRRYIVHPVALPPCVARNSPPCASAGQLPPSTGRRLGADQPDKPRLRQLSRLLLVFRPVYPGYLPEIASTSYCLPCRHLPAACLLINLPTQKHPTAWLPVSRGFDNKPLPIPPGRPERHRYLASVIISRLWLLNPNREHRGP